jgi:CheY-like chemotaxis protein
VNIKPDEILIVDDDPIIRDMMVDILSFERYPLRAVRNGYEALTQLRSDVSFLIFLDILMPVMDGHKFCRFLNANPQLRQRHIVVVMSALDNLIEAASLNADAMMPKPFSVDDVIQILEPFMQ